MSAGIIILGLFLGILILLILVTIHEFAHFIVAKLAGAYVYEFAIGFGPKIISWGKKETKYSIRIFPFGGYVYIASELTDPPKGREDEVVPKACKMENIARWKRLIFIVAGALMNFFIAVFIFTTMFAATGMKTNDMTYWGAHYDVNEPLYNALVTTKNKETCQDVVILNYWLGTDQTKLKVAAQEYKTTGKGTPDVTRVDIGTVTNIPNYYTTVYSFLDHLKTQYNSNEKHDDLILLNYVLVNKYHEVYRYKSDNGVAFRDGNLTEAVPLKQGNNTYVVGIAPPNRIYQSTAQAYGAGWTETFNESVTILKSFGLLFTGQWQQLSGPVGIAKTMSTIVSQGPEPFFMYVAMLSANLFVLNLIPIPPLDGFKFLETIVESLGNGYFRIRQRILLLKYRDDSDKIKAIKEEPIGNWQLPHKWKIVINVTGAVLFIGLFIGITIKDVFF
ncbi:site-2 protease family protein [Spiroplasma eriocheiris]|uniref:Inner membrane zinc metalloprotease n=1 Tax=Spiroplasma eriocheiris TaxID=315358 RepID=A0A0H3XHY4_9MOLU|nr:site-2 protease family protein [Spiroplasma eriocheiris]AHF57986.1 membrane associated Zn-dependent protease [Spiroplasma eriocheiris CCTCC M 207170]AKM54428.1 inner membrane zinc metalloprotease [Spiroplasma eriocheiris]